MPQQIVADVLAATDHAVQCQQLTTAVAGLTAEGMDEVASLLKSEADRFLRADIQRCLQTADLLVHLANLTDQPLFRAMGLRARANAYGHGGLGEFQRAIEIYDEAAEIHERLGQAVLQAATLAAKLVPLARLGRYDEAFEIGRQAADVFEANGEWLWLAKLSVNLGIIQGRLGEENKALALYDRAQGLYRQLGQSDEACSALARVEQNRALVLRHLGRFEEAVRASEQAWKMLSQSGQHVEAARARQNLAITYFISGRYNEALTLLDQARDVFLADGRQRDAILVELFTSDCLLQLRRFTQVLEKCRQVRELFTELGTHFEVAQSILNEAVAYAGLERFEESLAALDEARRLFYDEGYPVWVASTDLEMATVLLKQVRYQDCLAQALTCARVFARHDLPLERSQSLLVAARAAIELAQYAHAGELVEEAIAQHAEQPVPALCYQGYYLQGVLAEAQGDRFRARRAFDLAADTLESLRGRLMLEFRSDFLEDKQVVYESLVQLSLDIGEPEAGLKYAERAKSRALLELLAFRLNLGLEARADADQPLVESLIRLRAERDRLYRRWEGGEATHERGLTTAVSADHQAAQRSVIELETQITQLWHRLLIRNADYARDLSLWQVRTEPVQPHLGEDVALVEYFSARGSLIAFVVTGHDIRVHDLGQNLPQIRQLLQMLWLNLRAVPFRTPSQIRPLTANARGVLERLYGQVMAPLADDLAPFNKIIVVPHGSLHYLPFHALWNGDTFLLTRHEISYLPSASLLGYRRTPQPARQGLTAVGHSFNGLLPFTGQEARQIASIWPDGRFFLEQEATVARLQREARTSHILHLACHADFRPDNPLFSGLALGDGWLTTLDIFNLQLEASLVTLSACQTGRNVVSGGDELLGLMRAFLSAGAASLVLSLWSVEDRSTALFMEAFYDRLKAGRTKGAALRQVQQQFAGVPGEADADSVTDYSHPYFWAPFYLVGDSGPI